MLDVISQNVYCIYFHIHMWLKYKKNMRNTIDIDSPALGKGHGKLN